MPRSNTVAHKSVERPLGVDTELATSSTPPKSQKAVSGMAEMGASGAAPTSREAGSRFWESEAQTTSPDTSNTPSVKGAKDRVVCELQSVRSSPITASKA